MLEKKSSVKLNILDFLLILIILYTVAPIVSRFISSYLTTYVYMLVIVAAVALLLLCKGMKSINDCILMLAPFLAWKLMAFFMVKGDLVTWGYGALLDLVPILAGYYMMNCCNDDKNKFFMWLVIAVFAITLITTVIGCIQHEGAARYLATVENANEAKAVLYGWLNLGGYQFVYMVVLLHPIVVLAYKKGKIKKWVAIVCSVAVFLLAIYSEYTTALLLTLFTCVLYFFKKDLKPKQLIGLTIAVIAVFTVFSELFSNFLNWLADIIGSDTIALRLKALAGGRTGIENSEDDRIVLYEASLRTFFNNPLLGTFLSGGGVGGGHSFILDFAAQFGIVGIALLVYMYRTIYKFAFAKYKGREGYGYILWIFLQTLLLSAVNTGMWLSVLTLFVPILLRMIYAEEKNENLMDR